MKTLPDLQQIEILILIVKHGSFRQAAKALNLSPPALTVAINHLEEKLGVRLLNRSTRSLSLTAVGEEFLNNITPVVNDYRRVVDSLNYHRLTPEGVVKVNLPRIVIDLFFRDYFIAFKNACPNVTLELYATDRKVNIIESGFDAGIRYSQDVPKEMIAIPFGEKLSLIPVASPDYIREAGEPDTPQSLVNFRCINRCFPDGEKYRWEFIGPSGELSEVAVKGDLVVDPGRGERIRHRLCLSVAGDAAAERGQPGPFVTRLPLSCRPFLRLLPKPETYSRPPAGLYRLGDGAE